MIGYKIKTFMPIEGIWKDVAGDSGTLADTLERLNILIDDNTQFCRIIQYDNKICRTITYRAYNGLKITITLQERKNNF